MRIADAGVVVELLAGDLDPDLLDDGELVATHLIDSEVTPALQSLVRRHVLTHEQGNFAMEGFSGLTITKFPAG